MIHNFIARTKILLAPQPSLSVNQKINRRKRFALFYFPHKSLAIKIIIETNTNNNKAKIKQQPPCASESACFIFGFHKKKK
jgi:hypothetical protein